MKIVFIAWPGEGEYDLYQSCLQNNIDIEMYFTTIGHIRGYLNFGNPKPPYSGGISLDPPRLKYNFVEKNRIGQLIDNSNADLFILKYPQGDWSLPQKNLHKTICWLSEQGITKQWAIKSAQPYIHIGVNNKQEMAEYTSIFPNKKIHYMPFGCYIPSLSFQEEHEKSYDLLVDGRFPSGPVGNNEADDRRQSITTMIDPVKDKNIAYYGVGWELYPSAKDKHKGLFNHWEYPDIYTQARIYLGITWNWRSSGFGIKLARAMSCGIPVIWHYTPGLEKEGFERGVHIEWSSSPMETQAVVNLLLSDTEKRLLLGANGRNWAIEHWEWGKIIKRIVGEL